MMEATLISPQTPNPPPNPPRRELRVEALPGWLGPEARAALRGMEDVRKVRCVFSRGERKLFRRRRPIPVSQWAEKYRVLEMSSIPGRWKNVFTPYLVGVMDAMGTPGVETVIICKSPQTGGSEAGHNFVGWCVDRSPGPVMYVFPDEITARENARDRIIPMLEASPRLRDYMTGSADDASSLRINLAHMPIYLGWSGSVSRLGNKPIRTLILDELDKYKNPKNEAASETLAEKRTTTWRTRRHIVKISTPTTPDGPIWRAFNEEAGARFDYHVRCPHCGMWQRMAFERIGWPGRDTDAEPSAGDVLAGRLAFYPCGHCGAVWDDADRDRAVRRGEWRDRASGRPLEACLATRPPSKLGFHIPAWLSYFVSLSEVAAAHLTWKASGRLDDLKNLQNQYKAEPWVVEHAERAEDAILALCDDRPRGTVPGPVDGRERVCALLAGVDTQGTYFRYVLRAFGYGRSEASWLVQCGSVNSLESLDDLLWNSAYADAAGREIPVYGAMMDAMGGRTAEIYRYAARHRGRVFPWQGVQSMTQPYTPSPQEYLTDARGNRVRIPGGINLWRCDTTFFKNDLAAKLAIAPDDPGAFRLHSNDRGELAQYARELCAEIFDAEKGVWLNPKGRPNHYWDCEVMVLALAYVLGVRNRPHPDDARPRARRPPAPARGSRPAFGREWRE